MSGLTGRGKRPAVPGGRTGISHRVLCSVEEEARLQAKAVELGLRSIPDVLMQLAFAPVGETGVERAALMAELLRLDRQISGIATNINQGARRANVGDGFPVVEAREWLVEGRACVVELRARLRELAR